MIQEKYSRSRDFVSMIQKNQWTCLAGMRLHIMQLYGGSPVIFYTLNWPWHTMYTTRCDVGYSAYFLQGLLKRVVIANRMRFSPALKRQYDDTDPITEPCKGITCENIYILFQYVLDHILVLRSKNNSSLKMKDE